jgi:adenosylcobyric acid synthase
MPSTAKASVGGSLLVAGTTSDAGKNTIVAGICRWLHRQGVRVAPFKAQNMSNNSVVVLDDEGRGGEIGRAQAFQAAACGLAPSVLFNPVLLKPGSDMTSQVIVHGQVRMHLDATTFAQARPVLAAAAYAAFDELRATFDVVICEGAGSPTEINLREHDFVNMGLARYGDIPVIVAGDIDRGGVFAALYGTLALLSHADQRLVSGFVINKFRGDAGLLQPGIDTFTTSTGRPTLGVIPWEPDLWIDAEDSLSLADGRIVGRPASPRGSQWLRVAAVRLPRISNATDVEALAAEPGVAVRLTTSPAELADTDLIVLPGSKSTVDDLRWLRETGLADAIVEHVRAGRPVLGICGGFQMLGRAIHDDVESRRGRVEGLGLLPIEVTFAAEKTLGRAAGTAYGAIAVDGYEIHHGYVSDIDPALAPWIRTAEGHGEGAAANGVFGTHWHGALESDAFRRAFLADVARRAGRDGFAPALDTIYAARREQALDLLGDLVEAHIDTNALWRLIETGAPADLAFISPGAAA